MTSDLRVDLSYGLRTLRRSPTYTAVAALTLAVGIGSATAVFGAVRGILLAPLPYPEPDRLAVVEINSGGTGWYGLSVPEFLDLQSLEAFEAVGAYSTPTATVGDSLDPRRARVGLVTAEVLPLVGVEPAMGRWFTAEEDTPDGPNVAILSDAAWRRDHGASPDVLGRTVRLQGRAFTVVGVMPPGFGFPDPAVEFWVPWGLDRDDPDARNNHYLSTVARLNEGVGLAGAASALDAFAARTRERHPSFYSERGFRARVVGLHRAVVGDVRTPLLVLLAAVGLFLLLACANVANLVLSRGDRRRGELAVRAALGAGRGRVTRQLLTENVLLAVPGAALGLLLAVVGLEALVRAAPEGTPRLEEVALDAGLLPFVAGLLLVTVLLSGVVPALRPGRTDLRGALGEAGRDGTAGGSASLRRLLVVVQVALAGALVAGTGMMVRTLGQLQAVETGFRADGVLSLAVDPVGARYPEPRDRVAFYERLLDRLESLPGVERAGAALGLPLQDPYNIWTIVLEGRPVSGIGDAPDGRVQIATPGYFETMELELRRGRFLRETDQADAPPVAVVDETMARRFWPGEDPIGQRFRVWVEDYPWIEVVGVVRDERIERLDEEAYPTWYVPPAQSWRTAYTTPLGMRMVLRTGGDPATLVGPVRQAVREVDPTAAVSRFGTMREAVDASLATRTFTLEVLRAFGVVALFLACVGVYGVLSLQVGERRREIGLRKALGAGRGEVLRGVLGDSARLLLAGTVVGLAGGLLLSRGMGSLLFGVGLLDPLALAGASILLLGTGFAAAWLPAWRAGRVDPMAVLRE